MWDVWEFVVYEVGGGVMEIVVQVSDELGRQLELYRDRMAEVVERGLQAMLAESSALPGDEAHIMELLTSQPTPEQVLALTPSPEMQARVSDLLVRSKQGQLAAEEEKELDRYLMLEHLVRLAKTYAFRRVAGKS